MTTHRVLAAMPLVAVMALMLPLAGCKTLHPATQPATQSAATQAVDHDTPERDADGRVAPTIHADADAYTYANLDERIDKLNKVNDDRNKLLADHPLPIAVAVRVPDGSIKIDGKLDEPAWKQARVITNFKEMKTGDVVAEQTKIRLLWDSKYLYVGAECADSDIQAQAKEHDGEVWNDDAVEIFVNPSGDEMSYLQFDINPLGTWYDAMIADYRPESDFKAAALDMEKSPKVFNTKNSKWAVTVDGAINSDTPGQSKSWTAEIAIAWSDIDRGTNVIHQVPQDGDVWRMNFGRINISSSGDNVFSSWSPTVGWFHCPWLFGRVVFVKNDSDQPAQTQPDADAPSAATEPAK